MPRALAALALALVACTGTGAGGITTATGFNVLRVPAGERATAPSIAGEMLAGQPVDPTGAVTVVNFWGSWCGPCREEQPRLQALWERYRDRGVLFVGINTRRDQRAAAEAFLREFEVTYPSVYDPDSSIAFDFGVRVMPATIVLDTDGRIAARVTGAVRSEADLTAILDEELSEQP